MQHQCEVAMQRNSKSLADEYHLCPGLQYTYKFDGVEKNPAQQFSLEALHEAIKNGCLGYCLNDNSFI